jgi:dCMP deaminase
MDKWDARFMALAQHIGTWSQDRSRKVGCVIVGPGNDILATGFNGFPRGVDDSIEERYERPAKYLWTEHAERNAIFNATRIGVSLVDAKMYLPWFPCVDCARAIIQVGIVKLIAFRPDLGDSTWGDTFAVSLSLFREAGIEVCYMDDKSGTGST